MGKNKVYLNEILKITNKAENKIFSSTNIIGDFAELMDEYWWLKKKKLASKVTNKKINDIFNLARKNSALSGKVWGQVVVDLFYF